MYCPFCRHPDTRVIDSRVAEDGTAIRRRRSCPECGRRFTTQESVILMVAKRSGVTEPSRQLVITTSRRSHVTWSYGCTPGVVWMRRIFSPLLRLPLRAAEPLTVSVMTALPPSPRPSSRHPDAGRAAR